MSDYEEIVNALYTQNQAIQNQAQEVYQIKRLLAILIKIKLKKRLKDKDINFLDNI